MSMQNSVLDIVTIAQVIQTAVAPVFLLSGVAAFLSVLSSRLGRISDRAKILAETPPNDADHQQLHAEEMEMLLRRAKLINQSFNLCTICALTICFVVVMIFYSHMAVMHLGQAISIMFIVAMILLIGGLLSLLSEIYLATRSLRHGLEFAGVHIIKPS